MSNEIEFIYRINVGGKQLASADASIPWSADTYKNPSSFRIGSGGNKIKTTFAPIDLSDPSLLGSAPEALFQSERWDAPLGENMQWEFPVNPGSDVEVRLYFAETYKPIIDARQRVFDVSVEGVVPTVFDDIDQYQRAGYGAFMLSHTLTVNDNGLNLEFFHGIENPALKGIEILSRPIEIPQPDTPTSEDPQPEPTTSEDPQPELTTSEDPQPEPAIPPNSPSTIESPLSETLNFTVTDSTTTEPPAVNNNPPVAVCDSGITDEDQGIIFSPANLLSNDSDPDGDSLQITSGQNPLNGSVVLDSNGNIVFTPNANFHGDAGFEYVINDGNGGTATANVNLVVNSVNDAPVAIDDLGTTKQNQSVTFSSTNLLGNDSDIDGDNLEITSVKNSLNGSVTLNVQKNPIFTPNLDFTGDASFEYTVSDGNGGTATATVKVSVSPVLSLPNLGTLSSPTSKPDLTTGFDTFAPSWVETPETGSTNSLTPQIAEWTRTGERGETLVLTGWQFSNLTGEELGSDTKFWVYGQTDDHNGVLVEATLQKLDGDIAAITLPQSLPEGSSFLVWAENESGYSKPVMINQTETWWMQEKATRGQVASVFGRNLSQDGGTEVSHVYLEDSAGKGYWAEVVEVNPYKIDFKVPDTLANGDYQVYVHNGDGGEYNWSAPLTMTVNDGLNYSAQVFNVKDYGAVGDGTNNDATAIQNAINAASKVRGTVYFPSGTYAVHNGWAFLVAVNNIRFLGEEKESTTIKVADGAGDSYLFQSVGTKSVTFENLTLDGNVENGANPLSVVHLREAEDLHFVNVRIDGEGTKPLDLHGSNGVFLQDSEVIGAETFLGTAKQVFIDGTEFYGTDYRNSIITSFGVEMLSVTNSVAQNLDTSDPYNNKWVKGRFFVDQPHWGMAQNHYFGNNRTIDMAPPPADGLDRNSGEQLMWESNSASVTFLGATNTSLSSGTLDTVTFGDSSSIDDNWHITIVGGKGVGQTRRIKYFDSATNSYELDKPWNVEPDQSSSMTASKIVSQAVVYGNQLDGTTEAYNSPTHVASAGVQVYHGATDLVIDKNTFHELRAGVSLWTGFGDDDVKPLHFTQVTNNKFQDILTGLTFLNIAGRQGTSIIGTTVRENELDNVDKAFEMFINHRLLIDTSYPYTNVNVFESNTLGVDVITAFDFEESDSIQNNVLLNNVLTSSSLNLGVHANGGLF